MKVKLLVKGTSDRGFGGLHDIRSRLSDNLFYVNTTVKTTDFLSW